MRILRLLFLFGLIFLVSGCRPQRGITLHAADVAQLIWSDERVADSESATLPDSVVVAIDVENRGASVLLREGRLRVSYRGRRVAMLSLDEKVRIKRHSRGVILLPLKLSVARNSQSVALWQALRQHEAGHITLDYEVAVRVGVVRAQLTQSPIELSEVVQGEKLEHLWLQIDKMLGVENVEKF